MRISRRTSGGRGEYEISEETTGGLRPADLVGLRLQLDFGDGWLVDTATILVMQGGKPRIRRVQRSPRYIQLARQLTAALMMPHPARQDEALGAGLPIMRTGRYAVEHVMLGDVQIARPIARLIVDEVLLRNNSNFAENLGFADRVARVRRLWANAEQLPTNIRQLTNAQQAAVRVPGPIVRDAEEIVSNLQAQVTASAEDLGLSYRSIDEDVLEHLEQALALSAQPPSPPVAVAQVDPEETIVRRRVLKQWKRWANSRGAVSAVFRQQVRAAYNSTCIVCGVYLPATSVNSVPGVDAAHILPWAQFDLDVVANGLCLCKLHHWAFDEGLIVIREENGEYFVEVPPDVSAAIGAENPAFSLQQFEQYVGRVPEARLPPNRQVRPSPQFLAQLLNEM
jgi:putative restriction endonuclease